MLDVVSQLPCTGHVPFTLRVSRTAHCLLRCLSASVPRCLCLSVRIAQNREKGTYPPANSGLVIAFTHSPPPLLLLLIHAFPVDVPTFISIPLYY